MKEKYTELQALEDCAKLWKVLSINKDIYKGEMGNTDSSYRIKAKALNIINLDTIFINRCPCCHYLKLKNRMICGPNCRVFCPLRHLFCINGRTYCQDDENKGPYRMWEQAIRYKDLTTAIKYAKRIWKRAEKRAIRLRAR